MYRRRGSSYQFLKLAEEAGHLGFWSFDLASDEMLGSPGLARIVGEPPTGDPRGILDGLIHPGDRAAQADLHHLLHCGRGFERVYRIVRTDRTLRWIKVRAEVVLGPGDVPTRAEGIVVDVTESEQVHHQAVESQARYHGVFQAIGAVLWTSSPEGQLRPSSGWQSLTGQTSQAIRDDGWLRAIHECDRDRLAKAWRIALGERARLAIQVGVICWDGRVRRFNCIASPLFDENGTVHEWIGALLPVGGSRSDLPCGAGKAVEVDGALVRAARAWLDWSMAELARRARVSVASVKRFEDPRQAVRRPKIRQAILAALTRAGIAFGRDGDGVFTISRRGDFDADAPADPKP